jgi:hypothetical protein
MTDRILVFYGSYRSDRMGIRLADFVVRNLRERGADAELIDAKAVGLPMLDRMYKEHPKGQVPAALEELAQKIIGADGFVFVTGEYNWGIQPGLKNLTDHFGGVVLAACGDRQLFRRTFFRRAGRAGMARHAVGDGHGGDLDDHRGRADRAIALRDRRADRGWRQGAGEGVSRFADDLMWWVEAAREQRARKKPPY